MKCRRRRCRRRRCRRTNLLPHRSPRLVPRLLACARCLRGDQSPRRYQSCWCRPRQLRADRQADHPGATNRGYRARESARGPRPLSSQFPCCEVAQRAGAHERPAAHRDRFAHLHLGKPRIPDRAPPSPDADAATRCGVAPQPLPHARSDFARPVSPHA